MQCVILEEFIRDGERSVGRSVAGRDWPSKSETGEIGGEQIGQLGAIGPRRGA